MKSCLQVYTGNGKGKTTAAIGLAVRAAGAGFSVLFIQFAKAKEYSEIKALKRFSDNITLRQYGREDFIVGKARKEDIAEASKGLDAARKALESGNYRMLVLDEASIAVYYNLFTIENLLSTINRRGEECEVVITGRYAPKELIEAADLVTEMRDVKHYYDRGIAARKGIEF